MSIYRTISVIMPTYNRKFCLEKTLYSYQRQKFDLNNCQLIIIDDGSKYPVRRFLKIAKYPMEISLLRQVHSGPAKARNKGIGIATGDIVIFAGDDITVDENFLQKHMNAHNGSYGENMAILGKISWHNQITKSILSYYLSNESEELFSYFRLKSRTLVSFWNFYTSNISLKLNFLKSTKQLFSENFIYPCYEDIEMGYRLMKKEGLKVLYHDDIQGYHNHEIDLKSFYERQFKAGQMQKVFNCLHPDIFCNQIESVKNKNLIIYDSLPKVFYQHYKILESLKAKYSKDPSMAKMYRATCNLFFRQVFNFAIENGLFFSLQQK